MYFTEGRLRTYERIMQEKPKHDRETADQVKDEKCKQCLDSDKHSGNCGKEKCMLPHD